jgi:hypothetical protein
MTEHGTAYAYIEHCVRSEDICHECAAYLYALYRISRGEWMKVRRHARRAMEFRQG